MIGLRLKGFQIGRIRIIVRKVCDNFMGPSFYLGIHVYCGRVVCEATCIQKGARLLLPGGCLGQDGGGQKIMQKW